jgi:hypothetical protein
MDLAGFNWSIMTIVGPILLALVLLWVLLRSRTERVDPDRTERATHDVYDEEEAARRDEDGDAP